MRICLEFGTDSEGTQVCVFNIIFAIVFDIILVVSILNNYTIL